MGWARKRSLMAHLAQKRVGPDTDKSEAIRDVASENDVPAREVEWAYEQLFE